MSRDAIERELGPLLVQALDHLCRVIDMPRSQWQRHTQLRMLFETAAALTLANTLLASCEEPTWEGAVHRAAARLHINGEAVDRRLRRWGINATSMRQQQEATKCPAP